MQVDLAPQVHNLLLGECIADLRCQDSPVLDESHKKNTILLHWAKNVIAK